MTFNREEPADRVRRTPVERQDLGGGSESMSCPEGVAIEKNTAFGCSVVHEGHLKTVRVVVVDAGSGAIEVGALSK